MKVFFCHMNFTDSSIIKTYINMNYFTRKKIVVYSENDYAKFRKAEIAKSICCKNILKLAY